MLRTEQIGDTYVLNYRYDDNGTLVSVSSYNISTDAVNILYAQTNTRGDVISLYDGNGDIRTVYTYDSWGKLISVTDGEGNALSANKLGSLNSIRYRGYVYDSETGLYYLQSRYYDPEVGRFLNADSVDYIGYSDSVISYNVFAYCENNAVNMSDCLGNFSIFGIEFNLAYWHHELIYLGKNIHNKYIFWYCYYNDVALYDYQQGVNYHSAIFSVSARNVQVVVCLKPNTDIASVKENKKYIKAIIKANLTDDITEYIFKAYKETYGCCYKKRSSLGVELELVLHMYMYYFDIDKSKGYKSSKEIDIDNDGNGLIFEKKPILAIAKDLISTCKKSIKSGVFSPTISAVLYAYLLK